MSDVTLYWGYGSRAYSSLWLLEELGLPYRSVITDYRPDRPKPPGYGRLNPHGQVPTLTDGEAVVSETPAICLFLADRYGYGELAPRIEEPERGPYLKWIVYATAVLEPARGTQKAPRELFDQVPWSVGWKPLPQVIEAVAEALEPGPWLLGERFTAADVMLGATVGISLVSGAIAPHPVLNAYHERLMARPACAKAAEMNWPAWMFRRS